MLFLLAFLVSCIPIVFGFWLRVRCNVIFTVRGFLRELISILFVYLFVCLYFMGFYLITKVFSGIWI